MARTQQILLLANDPSLRGEVESALEELPDEMSFAVHTEGDRRRGIEHAVTRTPDLVLLELDEDVDEAHRAAMEIRRGATDPKIVVVYRPQVLGGDAGSNSLLIDLMRAGVQDFLRRPVSTPELAELLRRHLSSAGKERAARGRVISFLGNKGGVGKSTLSLSVACSLARTAPGRVLLIDASLQHGAMCDLLGVVPEANLSDAARQIDRLDERLLRMFSASHESGLRVLAAPNNAIEAAPVDDQALARILSVARRAFDYVIVDTFPLIDSVTVAILDVADLVFVVTSDFVPVVIGTVELLEVLDRIGVSQERIRVVLNHSSPGFRGRLKPVDVSQRLGRELDFVVPFSRRALASTNTGEPHVLRAPRWWGFGKALRKIETEVLQWKPKGLGSPKASLPEVDVPATRSQPLASDAEPEVPEVALRRHRPVASEEGGGPE